MSRPIVVIDCMFWLLRIVGPQQAPTFMALTCRWRSRPQHQKATCAALERCPLSPRHRTSISALLMSVRCQSRSCWLNGGAKESPLCQFELDATIATVGVEENVGLRQQRLSFQSAYACSPRATSGLRQNFRRNRPLRWFCNTIPPKADVS
jgi:hypothetical protein